jgi:hypothetical protein
MGRVSAKIDADLVEDMLSRGADVKMVCAMLRISRETFYKHCKRDPKLAEALKYGRDRGDADLHFAQYASATKHNNVKMQQWLGMQRLGQYHRNVKDETQARRELDVFTALGVNPDLLSDEDINTLLQIVRKGRPGGSPKKVEEQSDSDVGDE